MTIDTVQELLRADVLAGRSAMARGVSQICACDLLSDVLAFVKPGALLLTGLTNPQVVRTADVSDLSAICFVRGKTPPAETLRLARENGLPLLATTLSMYECCGLLYSAGIGVDG